MKDIRPLSRIYRSLAGQTTLLSLALLLLALAYFVFAPILGTERPSPLQRTSSLVAIAIAEALFDPERPLSELRDNQDVVEVQAANNNFRIFVQRGAEELQIGGPAQWKDAIDYSRLSFAEPNGASEEFAPASSFAAFEFNEGATTARAFFRRDEGQETYYEIGGIEHPSERATGFLAGWDPLVFWSISQNYLAIGGAVLLGVLFLLFILARSLRRLANVAQSLDPQAPSHALPEKGLPTEVLPMVRAINRMIRRIDEANEEQAFFLAAAAHELRTPLAVVRTRLENLPDGPDKEELKGDLRRMTRLVDQLLRLMSVRSKGQPSETVDLVSIARKVVAERAPLVIRNGVEIDLDADEETVSVRGDERLLKVALANLLDNALSFSKSGQRLEVRVGPKRNITVRDQGPGISPNELENIFEPFAKTPPNRPGHGLGLAITRSIMALHGGSVNVTNLKDGGASFALQF